MKSKHMIRLLKRFAEQTCKPLNYSALEKFDAPRKIDGEYKTGIVVEHPVNHGRRVKKAFKKYGQPGAIAYVTVFKKPEEEPKEV